MQRENGQVDRRSNSNYGGQSLGNGQLHEGCMSLLCHLHAIIESIRFMHASPFTPGITVGDLCE